ncbi:MAG TPA: sodium:calcium antiporter [Candidatus Vogelbacteria bacterium]|nr:sodium:calcium antiporter [Candidatus Vogelbacteria bacterium]
MIWFLYISIFTLSCGLLYLAGEMVVSGLMKLSRFLGWKEFVVAFIVMALAASLPNLLVGITSALQGHPELSFGDVLGNNLAALTIAVALAVFFSPKKEIPADSRTVQQTSRFTIIAAILPLILVLDGQLSASDGIILIGCFFAYLLWLFARSERFRLPYEKIIPCQPQSLKYHLLNILIIFGGVILVAIAAQGIVYSAVKIAELLGISLVLIGILAVGIGNALPQIYFAVSSAKKNETWLILGNLMGSVTIPATLVLGVVALIHPITIPDISLVFISRIFMIVTALLFVIFTYTGKKINRWESVILILLYFLFIILAILVS